MKYLFLLNVCLILISGILPLTTNFKVYSRIPFAFSLLSSIIILIVLKKRFRINKTNLFFYLLFVLFCYFSAYINMDSALFNRTTKHLIDYILLIIIMPSIFNVSPKRFSDGIEKSLYITILPFILYSVIVFNPFNTPFQGVFSNPNSMGILSTIVSIALLSKIVKSVYLGNLNAMFLVKIMLFCLLSFVVIQSSSRTGFVTLLVMIIISLLFLIKSSLPAIYRKKRVLIILPTVLLIVFIIYKQFDVSFYIKESILDKFVSRSGDQLSGREVIWIGTLEEAKLFGNGSSYFIDTYNLTAHNFFIDLIGSYGWIPFISFTLFFLHVIKIIIKQLKTSFIKNELNFLPVFILISFMLISMTEELTLLMYVLYLLIGNLFTTNSLFNKNNQV